MYKIIKVENKKQLKQFINFQVELYKDCPYFVPPLFGDELKALDPKKSAFIGEDATAQCFLCVDENGKIVGRICGIISHLYNQKNNTKRVRFSRFDCIDNQEVANLLLSTVEEWGKENGMEVIHGPLGFNDMEREGLLIEGFDLMSTYNTQYFYPYFKPLLENYGYEKEVDWLEFRFRRTSSSDDRTSKLCSAVSKRLKITEAKLKSKNHLIKNYYNQVFDVLDEAYGDLYGTVPITQKMRDCLIGQFKLILNLDLISVLVDQNDRVVGFGLILPCISQSVHDCKGKLFPFGWVNVLKEIKRCDVVEMALIAVRKEYQNKGLTAIIFHNILERVATKYPNLKYCETNLELEENYKIQQLFAEGFDTKQVRRRRCFYKSLTGQKVEPLKAINPQN